MNKLDELKYQCLENASTYYDQKLDEAQDYAVEHFWTLKEWHNKAKDCCNKRYFDRVYYKEYYEKFPYRMLDYRTCDTASWKDLLIIWGIILGVVMFLVFIVDFLKL